MLEERGIDRNIALMFLEFLQTNPIWHNNTSKSKHIQEMLISMHKYSWSSMEYVQGVIMSQRGCLAGTPLADMLWCFLMIYYLTAVEKDAEEAGLIHRVDITEENYFNLKKKNEPHSILITSISYVDDCVFSIICPAGTIIKNRREITKILYKYAIIFNFLLN